MIWFGLVWWHINHCRLFNAKSGLYIYIWIYRIWFGLVWWLINHCRLFNAKSSLYIYIKYIWFGLAWFDDLSTIVGLLMPNLVYMYILNLYDLLTHFVDNTFKEAWANFFFFCTQLNGFKYFCLLLIICLHTFK